MSDHLDGLQGVQDQTNQTNPTDYYRGRGDQKSQYELDVVAVIAECRRLRKDVAALEGILSDVREDGPFAAGEQHGAARQLAEALSLCCDDCATGVPYDPATRRHATSDGFVTVCSAADLRALGPVRPPLPAERLAAENAELRAALEAGFQEIGKAMADVQTGHPRPSGA